VIKVRQAATTPAVRFVVIKMFSLGNLHAHCNLSLPASPGRCPSCYLDMGNIETSDQRICRAEDLPVSHHTSSGEEEKGWKHAHDDDQGDQEAALASKLLDDIYGGHKVEPCCKTDHLPDMVLRAWPFT